MTIEDVMALLMEALENQCAQEGAPRLLMVESDDLSQVTLDGSFDLRALAAHIAAKLPREPVFEESHAGSVHFDGKGGLTINIAPGALKKIG